MRKENNNVTSIIFRINGSCKQQSRRRRTGSSTERYSIVKATAARAKEIIDARTIEEKVRKARIEAENAPKEKEKDNKDKKNEPKPLTTPDEARKLQIGTPLIDNAENMKPLSIAVEELYEGKVKIVSNGDDSEIM